MQVFSFAAGPDDRRAYRADPEKKWRCGCSVRMLNHTCEAADGFPAQRMC